MRTESEDRTRVSRCSKIIGAAPAATFSCLRYGITKVILRRVKTAISIPDEIFEQAERLARIRGWSRSELYANAVSAFVNSERFLGVREQLDAVYGADMKDSAVDPLLAEAQARSILQENG